MKKSRFSEEKVSGILREGQSGMTVKAVSAKHKRELTEVLWVEAEIRRDGSQ